MAQKFRRFGSGVIAALTALFVMLLPASAQAAENPTIRYSTTPYYAPIYEVRAGYSWKCLDIRGESTSVGAIIQTFDCKGALHQRFTFHSVGNGNFVIGTWGGARCLGLKSGGAYSGTYLIQTDGWNCATFTWVFQGGEKGDHWEFQELGSGQCLHDTGRRSPVTLGACNVSGVPWPTIWVPRFDRYWNYDQIA
ncbi:RICIN domain-containing protein [Streptomyces vilmorinianum]|uniref:RICIN domain-containing protein n=1 Tax=Streptomyces vilmorinianum TaxID=3051092 RepID=UPI0010FB4F96|nr:RICIN domain-containing protein [Streptomyces vilmorinianum]